MLEDKRSHDEYGGIEYGGLPAYLDGFGHLPDKDREVLFETSRVWLDNDVSVNGAAEVLICPPTQSATGCRIEHHTGRSLSRPKDVAELCLAFEVRRRLM